MNLLCASNFTESGQFRLLYLPKCGKHPCRKVVFEIKGHEQSFHDPPDTSNSCFVTIVERFKLDEESEKSLLLAVGTSRRRGKFKPRESEPTIVAPSMYECHGINQQIIWRYDDNDEVVLSESLDRLQSPKLKQWSRPRKKSGSHG